MRGGLAVVLERLATSGLLGGARMLKIKNLEPLGSGEKHHVGRITIERVAEAALVHYQRAHAGALGLHRAGEAGWPSANTDQVVGRRHRNSLTSAVHS